MKSLTPSEHRLVAQRAAQRGPVAPSSPGRELLAAVGRAVGPGALAGGAFAGFTRNPDALPRWAYLLAASLAPLVIVILVSTTISVRVQRDKSKRLMTAVHNARAGGHYGLARVEEIVTSEPSTDTGDTYCTLRLTVQPLTGAAFSTIVPQTVDAVTAFQVQPGTIRPALILAHPSGACLIPETLQTVPQVARLQVPDPGTVRPWNWQRPPSAPVWLQSCVGGLVFVVTGVVVAAALMRIFPADR